MVLMGNPHVYREMNDVTGYLSRISGTQVSQTESMEEALRRRKQKQITKAEVQSPGQAGLKAQLQRRLPVKRQPMRVP